MDTNCLADVGYDIEVPAFAFSFQLLALGIGMGSVCSAFSMRCAATKVVMRKILAKNKKMNFIRTEKIEEIGRFLSRMA